MHTLEDQDQHYKEILLFPDYASSGLWCSCGLSIANPIEDLFVPRNIIELVDLWNSYWEACDNDGIKNEYAINQIISTGRILREMISEYIPCEFLEERCKFTERYKKDDI